ncbi:MAG: hypothetical protein L0H15_02590, partial [Nitrosospira sp.]|nr:hypothetical protein [Nitrosospira sp.]MDN5936145.1 hypothetical protein [Nitrosospira sp.]
MKVILHFLSEGLRSAVKQSQRNAEQISITAFLHLLDSLIKGINKKPENHNARPCGNPDQLKYTTAPTLNQYFYRNVKSRFFFKSFRIMPMNHSQFGAYVGWVKRSATHQ